MGTAARSREVRRALRKERRMALLKSIKALAVDASMTWADAAERLNARGTRNARGGAWDKNTLGNFVRGHERRTGERLLGCLRVADMRARARKASALPQLRRQAEAERLASLCPDAKGYKAVADALNRLGMKTKSGLPWSAVTARQVERDYRRATGNFLYAGMLRRRPRRLKKG